MLDVIIVLLKGASCIVRWINIDALHLPGVLALQRFQRQQIIPVDKHICCVGISGSVGQLWPLNQQPRLDSNWLVLADPSEFKFVGHFSIPPFWTLLTVLFGSSKGLVYRADIFLLIYIFGVL